ncbi:unnamed protein product, partial [Didymodactylos carnosus]
MHGRVRLGGR